MWFLFTLFTAVSASHLRASHLRACTSGICHDNVSEPCCTTCQAPLVKFISVDHGFGHPPFCGETCLNPNRYGIYHLFEPNLTKAENISHPCAHQYSPDGRKYSHYNSTITHGWPGVLSVTLDLYSP